VTIETALQSTLELLPANCTSVCQPLDVGVMGPFKRRLQTLWLEGQVASLLREDEDEPIAPSTPASKRLSAIKRAIAAWESLSPECIMRSFEKAIPLPESFEIIL